MCVRGSMRKRLVVDDSNRIDVHMVVPVTWIYIRIRGAVTPCHGVSHNLYEFWDNCCFEGGIFNDMIICPKRSPNRFKRW